ncbi:hypothetical protein ISS21_01715 [Patescibacteria group bacterium]|nr:hypothetical protein [Patescibacteria group bacterium]
MKAFKVYAKEGGAKRQLIWLGAMLIIVGIVIAVINGYNYFKIPQETLEEFVFSPHALIIKELYLAAGIGVVGLVLLLAGSHAAGASKEEKSSAEITE